MDFMYDVLDVFMPYFERLNIYTMGFLGFILLLFILIFILGVLLWSNRLVGFFLLFLAFLIPTTSPLSLEWVSKNVFFPIDFQVEGRTLFYSPTFFVNGSLTPTGKLPIKSCLLTVTLNPKTSDVKQQIRQFFQPMLVNQKTIEGPFIQGETVTFQHAIDGIQQEVSSKLDISCF